MTKYIRVLNPKTGTDIFGLFPEIDQRGIYLPPGNIHLCHGDHYGPNKGFGVLHIIAEHGGQIARAYPALAPLAPHDMVVGYVNKILMRQAPVFIEADNVSRPVVIHTVAGGVILEKRGPDHAAWYSVVSAYNRKARRGELMASLL